MAETSTFAHEAYLMQQCAAGDAAAFEALVQPYLAALTLYLRRQVNDPDNAEELLQDVLVKVFAYLRAHPGGVVAFYPWLQQVATHAVIDFRRRHGRHPTVSLEEDGVVEVADPSPTPEGHIIARDERETAATLWHFLSAQLREVFLDPANTEAARTEGLLRLLAFLLYYRDGRSAPDVQRILAAHAERLGAAAPSATTLNNWLARGRLLRMVLQHLLDEHAADLQTAIAAAVHHMPVTHLERRVAVAYWCEGDDLDTIGASLRFSNDEQAEFTAAWAHRKGAPADRPAPCVRAIDDPEARYRLTAEGVALVYHTVTAVLRDELCRQTKAALHATRKA